MTENGCDGCGSFTEWPRYCVDCKGEICENCAEGINGERCECCSDNLADEYDDDDDLLYHYAVEPKHDRATLDRYLRSNPTRSGELLDLHRELTREPIDQPNT